MAKELHASVSSSKRAASMSDQPKKWKVYLNAFEGDYGWPDVQLSTQRITRQEAQWLGDNVDEPMPCIASVPIFEFEEGQFDE